MGDRNILDRRIYALFLSSTAIFLTSVGNKISLSKYNELIRQLPYLEHAFETKKETWEEKYGQHQYFHAFFEKTFTRDKAVFSRGDLFKLVEDDFDSALFSIILWGYPRDMRGNSFKTILDSLPNIKRYLSVEKELSEKGFIAICKNLKGKGLGLSTLSKLFYFFNFRLEGYKCLILDSKIIEVFNSDSYEELSIDEKIRDFNKEKKYLEYLQIMEKVSSDYKFVVDQLEMFLFIFGRSLKPFDK